MIAATQAAVGIAPLTREQLPRLWQYLQEFPQHNLDDFGPQTFEAFEQGIVDRAPNEALVGFHWDGEFIGAAAYLPFTPRSGALNGVCFAKKVHGSGIAREAMREFLLGLDRGGAEKISAQIHADNTRAWSFFKKMGFRQEGLFRAHTMRGGRPIDLRIIALFPSEVN